MTDPVDASRVAGIVFDLDGTLVDSYAAITESLNAARAEHDLAPLPESFVRGHVGRGLEQLVADLVGADRVEAGVRAFRGRYAEVYAAGTFALPGVSDTLAELGRRGYRMSVASNKPARFSRAILDHLGLLAHFVTVEGPDTAGNTKPDPAMMERCLAAMSISRRHAVYVGDMVLDVESADEAGLPVVLVPGGSSDPDALAGTGRTLLGSFTELLTILTGVRYDHRTEALP